MRADDLGIPVVFLHGLGVTSTCWDDVIDRLPGFQCVAIDLPGHGTSELVNATPSVESFAAHVVNRTTELGISRMHLVGMSLGGLVAQHIAATEPNKVDRLVLVDTVATYPEVVRQQWRDRAVTARSIGMESIIGPTLDTWFSDDAREKRLPIVTRVEEMVRSTNPEGYAQACEVLESADTRDLLSSLLGPTLVVCGRSDLPPFVAAVAEFEQAIPHVQVAWLEGKHGVSIEDPTSFASVLQGALAP